MTNQFQDVPNSGSPPEIAGCGAGEATIRTAPANPPAQICASLTAMLDAYDAQTLTQLLSTYNTNNPGHCYVPCFSITPPAAANSCTIPAATFGLPTIADGDVYIPTYQITSSSDTPPLTRLVRTAPLAQAGGVLRHRKDGLQRRLATLKRRTRSTSGPSRGFRS